jgi:hypothetical protein
MTQALRDKQAGLLLDEPLIFERSAPGRLGSDAGAAGGATIYKKSFVDLRSVNSQWAVLSSISPKSTGILITIGGSLT